VPSDSGKDEGNNGDPAIVLKGTTLAVYRYVFREGKPVGPHDIQRGLRLSSASVASYHLGKLLEAGLIRESEQGYVVDKVVFENVIRIRRLLIPTQISYVAFFATVIVILLTVLRPPMLFASYYFSVAALFGALALSVFEANRAASGKI